MPTSTKKYSKTAVQKELEEAGFECAHRGKVRDTYPISDDYLLIDTSDRASIFDFALPWGIPQKGPILNTISIYWFESLLANISNHFVASGTDMNRYLGFHPSLELQASTMIVKRLDMVNFELIVRAHLTGSGWKDYQKTGMVCGHTLPEGFHDGDKLNKPLFTPSTKATSGHDENIDFRIVREQYGEELEKRILHIFQIVYEYCKQRGIILADTKLEGSEFALGDEVFTPDSSRFWLYEDWRAAQYMGQSPQGYDKDVLRQWGKTVNTPFADENGAPIVGIHQLDPENNAHVAFVNNLDAPTKVLRETSERYHKILQLLTGMDLTNALQDIAGIGPE